MIRIGFSAIAVLALVGCAANVIDANGRGAGPVQAAASSAAPSPRPSVKAGGAEFESGHTVVAPGAGATEPAPSIPPGCTAVPTRWSPPSKTPWARSIRRPRA